MGTPALISQRALNRALLARQFLLRREKISAAKVIDHLVGLQAQVPENPYIGLWTRIEGFTPTELAQLITSRRAARISLMRSTIHLVNARDVHALRPLVQPVHERMFKGTFGRQVAGLDLAAVAKAGRKLVEQQPRTLNELGVALADRWPGPGPLALGNVVRTFVPLVQPPPRGVWGKGGLAIHASAEQWLGKPIGNGASVDAVFLRYLAAFGPASPNDAQNWSGLTKLKAVAERLRPRLLSFRNEKGVELFDLPGAPRPGDEITAPPRFLPEYDNVLLGHADRSRIADSTIGPIVRTGDGNRSWLLVDGMLRGAWKFDRERGRVTLIVEVRRRLPAEDRRAAEAEGESLLSFAFPALDADIRWVVKGPS